MLSTPARRADTLADARVPCCRAPAIRYSARIVAMLDRLDWDTYWRWELFRRACDPLDFRRWKRDSSRALRELFRDRPEPPRLLDSTAGLGDHTVNLAEEGFVVEACDRSALAREATRRALADAALAHVPVFAAEWSELGAARPERYDLVFNDALHWIYPPDELDAAVRGMWRALVPGGALVFFFADERDPEPDAGRRVLAWDWERMARAELAWDHARGDTSVTLSLVNERGPDFIDQHHLYVIRDAGAPARLESLTMRRVYRWDWHALSAALARAGFERLHSRHFRNVKGYEYAMNFAFRPR